MRQSTSSSDGSAGKEMENSAPDLGESRDNFSIGNDEEKAVGLDGIESSTPKKVEATSSGRPKSHGRRSQDSKSLKRIESHHSRAGADGYTWHQDGDESRQRPTRAKEGVIIPEPFLVAFDGDADPENPRSMSTLRRWIIVLICAASSLCV